jgi:BTB/POZ domain
VVIKVGSSQEIFHVHKAFLCEVSPFFRAALDGAFKEALEDAMTFPEDKQETFERFLAWLYFKEYAVTSKEGSARLEDKDTENCWDDIIDDHVFADKIKAEAFDREIMTRVLHAYQFWGLKQMKFKAIVRIYTECRENSSLRRLAVAMHECNSPHWFQDPAVARGLQKVPDFAIDLVKKLAGSGRSARKPMSLKFEELYD